MICTRAYSVSTAFLSRAAYACQRVDECLGFAFVTAQQAHVCTLHVQFTRTHFADSCVVRLVFRAINTVLTGCSTGDYISFAGQIVRGNVESTTGETEEQPRAEQNNANDDNNVHWPHFG